MDVRNPKDLLNKYNAGNCTAAEKAIVEAWFLTLADEGTIPDTAKIEQMSAAVWAEMPIHKSGKKQLGLWIRIATAAVVVFAIGVMLFFYNKKEVLPKTEVITVQNILPGGNKAILTLANGSKINLDDAINGQLAEQAGIQITKTTDGQIIYDASVALASENTQGANNYNIIETPKGGQYQVVLPDGTKVWLNAASSLKYPVSFMGSSGRSVELVGEAYFEVAKMYKTQSGKTKERLPFFVKTATQTVEVLGTHFNINSYTDEGKVVTTLAEGAVRVSYGQDGVLLKPNEQSVLANNALKVQAANIEMALAWKNGWFRFRDADIETILRQVARWYNLEIEYEGKVPEGLFTGSIPRSSKLSEVVEMFKASNVDFSIVQGTKGKKLIVAE